jgi:hypothetical protein
MRRLQRDADRNSRTARVPAIEQVIPAIGVLKVNIVGLIPVSAPVLRVWINDTEPITTVLEARESTYLEEWETKDTE